MSIPVPERAFAHDELVLHSLSLGAFETNCWLLALRASGSCIVVDPGLDPEPLLELITDEGLQPRMVLLTHAHLDHIGGCGALVRRFGVPIYLNPAERDLYEHLVPIAAMYGLEVEAAPPLSGELLEGQWVPFGSAGLRVFETPGHSPGGICLGWREGERLSVFCGDLIFRSSFGRTDLPGGDSAVLKRSILERLFTLPDDTVLLPGHGERTTIGEERADNPINDWDFR